VVVTLGCYEDASNKKPRKDKKQVNPRLPEDGNLMQQGREWVCDKATEPIEMENHYDYGGDPSDTV
jgi:hypothetical protein